MKRIFLLTASLLLISPAWAQDHHGTDHHDHDHDHQHEHQHEGHGEEHAETQTTHVRLTRTQEINAALDAGGEPVVAEVLGVVCDFCAKAMNKTFGKRDEVAAVYVDLDTKALNLVFQPSQTLSDEIIGKLVEKAGYKTKAIHRGDGILTEASDESDPS
ncbi:MAG: heavy-metal-associated domain-containing protein [Pseudomonadota bacterium]